jgi:RluA family pseudouridine synthase
VADCPRRGALSLVYNPPQWQEILVMHRGNTPSRKHLPKEIQIIHEDRDILVVDKAHGLLTIGTATERERTAYFYLTDYVRKGNPKARKQIFIVHRLDRDVSGLLVFAKTHDAKVQLQENWEDAEKVYVAVVHGKTAHKDGVITSYLTENRAHVVHATTNTRVGKLSETRYKVLRESERFSLLELRLVTGRKHQLRVHLADHGLPIVGDKKYGRDDKSYKRLALHALCLTFRHPYSGERLTFTSKPPPYFNQIMSGKA